MTSIATAIIDLRHIDRLADGNSAIHRLDPRVKVLTTFFFIVIILSFGRYEVSALIPFLIFPVASTSLSGLPPRYILTRTAFLAPFALLTGIFNPLLDREILFYLGPTGISGGWISLTAIFLRAVLAIGAATVLVATTGFPRICQALEQLGAPRIFVVQLLFLYRYIFVLAEEGVRGARSRELRSFGKNGRAMQPHGALVSHLLLRAWRRAERIHMAMLTRGFTGEFHTLREFRFGGRELFFITGWATTFIILRIWNLPQLMGAVVTGMAS